MSVANTKNNKRRSGSSGGTTHYRGAQPVKATSLSDQLKKLFRHPLIMLGSMLIFAAAAALASFTTPAKYSAETTVIAYALPQDPNAQATNQMSVDIKTEAAVASSYEVAEAAAQSIDPSNADLTKTIHKNIEVAAHSGTSILSITASAATAEEAATYANAVANSYLQVRQESLKDSIDANIARIREALNNSANNNEVTRTALEEKLAQAEITSINAGRVISAAQAPKNPDNLALWKYIAVGLALGAMVGAVITWIVDARLRKVSYRDRAEDALGQKVSLIRNSKRVEDTQLLLRALGTPSGNLSESGYRGLVIYSPTKQLAARLARNLRETISEDINLHFTDTLELPQDSPAGWLASENNNTVSVAPHDSSIADVLNAAEIQGSCVYVISPSTSLAATKEFAKVAESSSAVIEYVYLDK